MFKSLRLFISEISQRASDVLTFAFRCSFIENANQQSLRFKANGRMVELIECAATSPNSNSINEHWIEIEMENWQRTRTKDDHVTKYKSINWFVLTFLNHDLIDVRSWFDWLFSFVIFSVRQLRDVKALENLKNIPCIGRIVNFESAINLHFEHKIKKKQFIWH